MTGTGRDADAPNQGAEDEPVGDVEPVPATENDPALLLEETVDDSEDAPPVDGDGEHDPGAAPAPEVLHDDDDDDDEPDDEPSSGRGHVPVERDPSLGAPRRRAWPWVLLFLLASLSGVGAYLYFGVWRYEPTALHHVPQGANIVLRADAAKLLVWKPVREHLWPVFFERRGADAEKSRRVARIREATGVSLPTDLREIVIASVDGVAWVAIVGGNLASGRFVSGLHEVLEEEGAKGWRLDGEVLVHRSGATIGQAEDGTIVVATHRDLAESALPRSEPFEDAPLLDDEALGVFVSHAAVKRAVDAIPESVPTGPLRKIDTLSGKVALSDAPRLTLEVSPERSTPPEALASELSSMFSSLSLALLLVPGDLYGAKKAIASAEVVAAGERVRVDATWPYGPLDGGVKLLAETLSSR